MLKLNKKSVALLLALAFCVACEDMFSLNLDLGNGYEMYQADVEDYAMVHDGQTIVGPTIVSYDYNSEYVIGLVLENRKVQCENGPNRQVTDTVKYFVLNKKSHELTITKIRDDFVRLWKEVDPLQKLSLDFGQVQKQWSYYYSMYTRPAPNYWLSCVPLEEEISVPEHNS